MKWVLVYCLLGIISNFINFWSSIFLLTLVCGFRELNVIGFALVNLVYMDGVSLRVGIFKKEKWYYVQLDAFYTLAHTHVYALLILFP